MTYPDTEACLRTDLPFHELSDEEHHLGFFFPATGIGIVSQFVLAL
jgi:hypothetical protein